MVLDKDCREQLAPQVKRLLDDPALRKSISENALKMALPGADDRIVDRLLSIIG